jgi:hypothetical protein
MFLAVACGGNSMNNLSQPPQPTEPDMALLFLGSLFETLDYTLPPERDEAKLDALAWHILDKRGRLEHVGSRVLLHPKNTEHKASIRVG